MSFLLMLLDLMYLHIRRDVQRSVLLIYHKRLIESEYLKVLNFVRIYIAVRFDEYLTRQVCYCTWDFS